MKHIMLILPVVLLCLTGCSAEERIFRQTRDRRNLTKQLQMRSERRTEYEIQPNP